MTFLIPLILSRATMISMCLLQRATRSFVSLSGQAMKHTSFSSVQNQIDGSAKLLKICLLQLYVLGIKFLVRLPFTTYWNCQTDYLGLTFGDGSIPNHGFLYTTTHLSTLQIMKFSPIAIPEASYHHTISSLCAGYSHLQARLSDCAKQFSNEHSLGDMTTTKTWGLATHGQYVAACITLHPSEMIEYITPAHERATIVFSHSDLEDLPDADLEKEQQLCFPWEQPQQLRPASSVHAEKLDLILSTQSSSIFNPAISNIDARILYIAACSSTLLWTPQRSSLLAKARDSLIALQLHLDAVDFRPELDLLFNLTTSADNNPSSSPSDVLAQLDQAIYSRRTEEILAPLFETCAIPGCGALLGWANFSTARCKAGHLWSEFPTTFLSSFKSTSLPSSLLVLLSQHKTNLHRPLRHHTPRHPKSLPLQILRRLQPRVSE